MRQSYQTIKDIKRRDTWLKVHGYNPGTFFDPDLDCNFVRAKAATKKLLKLGSDFLTANDLKLLYKFHKKQKATQKQIFQILNLNKRIKRQLHKQV
jgi:hypothetical protein